ncbi:MAG TPA: ATP-binding cassette domain-containing protein [Mycobacteriales bacterium]|nr:ATP-binding cassette domain-containing protein [Mycobacteriales bacterium]
MPPDDSTPAIDARDLVKTYPKGVRALDGLSFTVAAGTVFGLLGPNGAGKSTTVKILTTLSRPDSGIATVVGIDVRRHPDRVRRIVGCVAQRSGTIAQSTGREDLLLQGRIYGMSGRDLRRRVDELLDRFDLAEAGDRLTGTYSGGMRRKLEIALGLVHRPRVLFLDEPTTGLDPEARTRLWQEIARLSRDEGMSILLTTHYLEEADKLASRLAIVDAGRVVAEGTPEQLKGDLHGDTIQVELADGRPPDRLDVAGIRDVVVDGRVLRARADNGGAAVPAVLAALESAGVAVASVTVSRPSLDEVYLRHAGRAFADADRAADRGADRTAGSGTAEARTYQEVSR